MEKQVKKWKKRKIQEKRVYQRLGAPPKCYGHPDAVWLLMKIWFFLIWYEKLYPIWIFILCYSFIAYFYTTHILCYNDDDYSEGKTYARFLRNIHIWKKKSDILPGKRRVAYLKEIPFCSQDIFYCHYWYGQTQTS